MTKKLVLFLAIAVLSVSNAMAYSWSVQAPSGQYLWYSTTSGGVMVTSPNPGNRTNPYQGYTRPEGALVIPSTIEGNFGRVYTVTEIDSNAFNGCYGLTSVTIPSTVTRIGNRALLGCRGLTSIQIPNTVTSIGVEAFQNCISLRNIFLPNSVTSIGTKAFWGCQALESITVPSLVTTIANYTFFECTSLANVNLPSSITSIGERAFQKCRNLANINIPTSVTTIGQYAFSECSSLTQLVVPSTCYINYQAFYLVRNIVYSGSIYGLSWGMLSRNGYVEGPLVYADSTRLTLLGCATNATSMTIPHSVTSIGEYAFENCTNLRSIIIPNSVGVINRYAFFNCYGPLSITIPSSVTMIGEWAFGNVKNIAISNTVSGRPWGALSINGYVSSPFVYNNSSHTQILGCSADAHKIRIPSSVSSIASDAFVGCSLIDTIVCERYYPPSASSFTFNNLSPRIPVFVPCPRSQAYYAAEGWNRFYYIYDSLYTPQSIYLFAACYPQSGTAVVREYQTTCSGSTIVEAIPNEGYRFDRWTDGNTDNPRAVNLSSYVSLGYIFVADVPVEVRDTIVDCHDKELTLIVNDPELGTCAGSGVYPENTSATIMAIASPGARFVRWSDGNTANPRTLVLSQSTTLTAIFQAH